MTLRDVDRELLQAAKNMAYTQIRDLLDTGANPDAQDPATGLTALHYAVAADVTDFVRNRALGAILAHDPDVNLRDSKGATPLHAATKAALKNGRTEFMQALLDRGANSLMKDAEGLMPVDYARAGLANFYASVTDFLERWEQAKPEGRRYDEFAAASSDAHRKAATEAQERMRADAKKFKLKP